jgi:type II secretory pathway pseudopilin PulG
MSMALRQGTSCSAFTLIELVGVLAVIGLLAALLLPKVFEAIYRARISAIPVGLRTIQTAALEHFIRYDTLASDKGIPLSITNTYDDFDKLLVSEGFVDHPFIVKVGTSASVRLVDVSGLDSNSSPFSASSPGAYDLDGDGHNDIVNAKYLLEAVIEGPARGDVAEVNGMLDGPGMGFRNSQDDDGKGRVIYQDVSNDPNPKANPKARKRRPGTMYIYILHR